MYSTISSLATVYYLCTNTTPLLTYIILLLFNIKLHTYSSQLYRSFVNEIHQKSNQLLNQGQKPQGTVQPVGYDLHVTLNEMKEGLNIVKVSKLPHI